MATAELVCWKCGATLADLSLPLPRTDYCRACRAELHVCRLCRFYDIRKAKSCAEPVADEVDPSAQGWKPFKLKVFITCAQVIS